MKIKLLFLFIIANYTISFSQTDSTKIGFVSYWSIGDSYNFKISKIKQQWKEGEQIKDEEQEYIANFTVIDSTATSYKINWSYKTDLGNTYNIPDELFERFSKYELTEIIYETSEVGDFIEILNWKEVSEIMNNMFDDLIDVLGNKDTEKQNELRVAMQPFKQIYSSKQGIEEIVLKELQYFHFALGLEFDATQPFEYTEELPNMFGGKPIMAKAKIYFEDISFENSFCTIKQEMVLDPDDTKKLLEQVFKKMGFDDKGMKKAIKNADFKIVDNNTYEYYYNPGIPHRIETIRETVFNVDSKKDRRIDKTIIELIYNE